MDNILSIQSHVATGYVGNRAAVFPLQRLGCDVTFINTVQFSNHTGHGKWTGEIFSAAHIRDVLKGLWEHNGLTNIDAVLSGYLGTPDIGHVILETVAELKNERPDVIYCCDPVLGDSTRDIYVLKETAEFIKKHAIQAADVVTPNQFELGYLTGMKIFTLDDVLQACAALHQLGPSIILVTSLNYDELGADKIGMLLSTPNGVWITSTPRFTFDEDPTGSGDLITAIFLASYLRDKTAPAKALRFATAAVYGVFKHTAEQATNDLQIVQAQDDIVNPGEFFPVEQLRG